MRSVITDFPLNEATALRVYILGAVLTGSRGEEGGWLVSVNRVVEGGWLFVIRVRAGDVVFVRRGTEGRVCVDWTNE